MPDGLFLQGLCGKLKNRALNLVVILDVLPDTLASILEKGGCEASVVILHMDIDLDGTFSGPAEGKALILIDRKT